jgi:hypothetical protein
MAAPHEHGQRDRREQVDIPAAMIVSGAAAPAVTAITPNAK